MKNFSKIISALILSGLIASPVSAVTNGYTLPKSQTCSYDYLDGKKICIGEELFKEAVKQTIYSVGTHILNKYMPKNSNQNQYNNNNQVQYTNNNTNNNNNTNINSNNSNNTNNNNNNQNNQQNNVVEEKMAPISGNSNSSSGASPSSEPVVEEMIPL